MEKAALRASTARRFAHSLMGTAVPPLLTFTTYVVIAQQLGVSGRGEFAAASALFVLLIEVLAFGLPEAMTFAMARSPIASRRRLPVVLGVGTVAGLAGFGIAALLAPAISGGDTATRTAITVAGAFIAPNLWRAILRAAALGRHRWARASAERITVASTILLAMIVLAWNEEMTLVNSVVVFAAVPVVGLVFYVDPRIWRADLGGPIPTVTSFSILHFGMQAWVGSLAGVLLMRLDQILLNPLAGAVELGLYATAASLSEIPLIVNSALREVIFASEAADSSDTRVGTAARLAGFVCSIIAAVVALATPWLVPLLFGPGFAAAVAPTLILLAAVAIGPPGSIAGAALSGRGQPRLRSLSLVVAMVANALILAVLAPTMGAIGAALATFVGNAVASGLNMVFLTRRSTLRFTDLVVPRRSDGRALRDLASNWRVP